MYAILKTLLLSLLLLSSFTTVAAEPSQFALFAEEYNLPLGDVSVAGAPEALDNVPLEKLPQTFRDCFNNSAKELLLLSKDANGELFMEPEEIDKLTFTGPYYQLFLRTTMDSADPADFRRAFSDKIYMRYLIRLDSRPASVFTVTYNNDLGIYAFMSLTDYAGAEHMVNDLEAFSASERYTDEVFFIGIRSNDFIVNARDQAINSFRMKEPVTLTELAKAEYELELELKNAPDNEGGGSSLAGYLNRHRAAAPATGDNLTPWIIASSAAAALVCLVLLIARKRKKV